MSILIKGMEMPENCNNCPLMREDKCALLDEWIVDEYDEYNMPICFSQRMDYCSIVEVVRCKDCKHRPRRANKWVNVYGPKVPSSDYAQHMMIEDETCPFLCDDPFYSEIPPDDFFCAYGERD